MLCPRSPHLKVSIYSIFNKESPVKRVHYTLLAIASLILTAMVFPIVSGCEEEKPQEPTPPPGIDLSTTLVPNTDLDVYFYARQENPTIVLNEFVGTTNDFTVESLGLWGIISGDTYTVGGGLTLPGEDEADEVYRQIPDQTEIWALRSGRVIYFVHGHGEAAETLQEVVNNSDFKYYDNQDALDDIAVFPDGEELRLVAVAVAKPDDTLAQLTARYVTSEVSDLIETMIDKADLRLATAGLYSSEEINIAELARNAELSNILKRDTGILASVTSGWPGMLVEPIVGTVLENFGYTKTALGDVTVYEGFLEIDNGKSIPIIFRIVDNHLYIAASGQESYAKNIISALKIK